MKNGQLGDGMMELLKHGKNVNAKTRRENKNAFVDSLSWFACPLECQALRAVWGVHQSKVEIGSGAELILFDGEQLRSTGSQKAGVQPFPISEV